MNSKILRYAHDVGNGIYAIDTGYHRPSFDASYLLLQEGKNGISAAFIDVGTNYSAPRLMDTLEDLDLLPSQVDFIILTHVHLDHAGGAGEMMRLCPKAQLVVHPRGARHMADPSALRAGAVGVYGEDQVQKEYGQLLPVPKERILEAVDNFQINLGGRILRCMDTPGHAKHHITIWDQLSQGAFTGDTFGLSYREFDTEKGAFLIPTTTPIQFDPEAMRASVERIMNLQPKALFPTHYSKITNVPALEKQFLNLLDQVVQLGLDLKNSSNRHQRIKDGLLKIYSNSLLNHGCKLPPLEIAKLLDVDIELNAQGMEVWLG